MNRLQHSYQQITALLSRIRRTLIKKSQQHITKCRILKFLPPMHPIHINFLPVHSSEKISNSLKNGRRELNL